jgi:methylated-DNA-[protein]-cysteine S-methyltransferase
MKLRMQIMPPEHVTWGTIASPVGKLAIGLTDKGEVCRLAFLRGRKAADAVSEWQTDWPRTAFSGKSDVDAYQTKPVLLVGTPFQHAVWQAMARVPAGRVTTYGDIARSIGKPTAFRAVGAACGANPVPYLVPCHRVVAANGKLGGYSGGPDIKQDLLKIEGFLS